MTINLSNADLHLALDTYGAQLMSISTVDGVEYLWQGDPQYWDERSPILFPFVGRLTGGGYMLSGKHYTMPKHGFARTSEFSLVAHTPKRVVFELRNTPRTEEQYPFRFALEITYTLCKREIKVRYRVHNNDQKTMFFGIGGHPGFNCPLLPDERFEEYELVFSEPCLPDRIGFTPTVYLNGQNLPYPLKDSRVIPLQHHLFDNDAIALKNAAREVTLRSRRSGKGVRVSYPDMPYIGFWHTNRTEAPFVCIEPWSSLPDRQDIVDDWNCRSDLFRLAPGKTFECNWSITIL